MSGEQRDKASADKNAAGNSSSVFNVIPSVYYDLIARVCPGMAFWIALSFVSPDFESLVAIKSLTTTNILVLVVLSYIAGIVLTGFCLLWDSLSLQTFCLSKKLMQLLGLQPKARLITQWHLIAKKMEAVAKDSTDQGRIATKALAEVALCQNLLTGLLVLSTIGAYSSGKHFYDPMIHSIPYCLVGVALLASMLFRQTMFLGRVQALYELHVAAQEGDRA